MSKKMWCCLAITMTLLATGCIPQKKTTHQEPPVRTSVRTETIVITPVVTGKSNVKANVRAKAHSKTAVVDTLPKGTQIEIIAKNRNWYEVKRLDGSEKSGFVYHRLINLDFENYLGTRARNKQSATVQSVAVGKSRTITRLAPQTHFDILGYEKGFYRVKGDDFEGYIKADICVADPASPIAKTRTVTVSSTADPDKLKKTKAEQCAVPSKKEVAAAKKKSSGSGFFSIFNTSPKKTTKTASKTKPKSKYKDSSSSSKRTAKVKKSTGTSPDAGAAFFGAMTSALLGADPNNSKAQSKSGNNVPVQSENDVYKKLLQQISDGKDLARKTVKIREEMLTALNETRALQSLVGKAVSSMNNDYKKAVNTARGVDSTGMKKISIKAFIKDISYEPTETIEDASVKIAQNGKMLKALERQIKSEASDFSKLNTQQLQNMDSIISSFSNNLHASNAMYDFSMDKSGNVILGIDRAVNAYDEKAGPLAIEATKQAGILTLATVELLAQISNIQSNPMAVLTTLPRMIEVQDQLKELICLLKDFHDDYEYIEENSAVISKQGKDISRIIMTARRKNTQVTTMLESYYAKKMNLSSRLKKRLVSQTADGYKAVEKKAASVAIAEDLLD